MTLQSHDMPVETLVISLCIAITEEIPSPLINKLSNHLSNFQNDTHFIHLFCEAPHYIILCIIDQEQNEEALRQEIGKVTE